MKLSHVELILENCEVISIDAENIDVIYIDDISEYITIEKDDARSQKFAKTVNMVLDSKADKFYRAFDLNSSTMETVFKRLMRCEDICQIELVYCDGTHQTYNIKWADCYADINPAQKSCIKNGSLIVTIGNSETA